MAKSNIYRLISILTELADKIDENQDFWSFTVDQTLGIGLGCRALSGYLRSGAKDIITLQEENQSLKEISRYNKADADDCHKLLEGIFETQEEAKARLEDLRQGNTKGNVIYLLKKRRKWGKVE